MFKRQFNSIKTMKKETENTTQETPPDGEAMSGAEAVQELEAENAELKTAIRLSAAKEMMVSSLAKAGARSPALMFDAAKGELQFAEDGSVANSAALVGNLKARFPEQFGAERPNTSIDAGAGRINSPSLTKEALAAMKPSEIAKLDWADVRNVLSS